MFQVLILANFATAVQYPNPYQKLLNRTYPQIEIQNVQAVVPKIENVTSTSTEKDKFCSGRIFNDVYYDVEVIAEELGRPYNLVLHKFSGTLFFSHTVQSGATVDFGIMACHIQNKTCEGIKGIPGGYAVACDSGNDDVYLGGHDGIYKYNFLSKQPEFFAEDGKSIWGLFVRRNFYYILYPIQRLYVYQDRKFVAVAEAKDYEIDQFFVTKQMHIYFANKTAMFKVEKTTQEVILLDDSIVVRQIQEDSYGDVYICGHDGIYVEEQPLRKLKKVLAVDQTFGMTFDEHENVIYSDQDTIYKLVPSDEGRVCHDFLVGSNSNNEVPEKSPLRFDTLNTGTKTITYEDIVPPKTIWQRLKLLF